MPPLGDIETQSLQAHLVREECRDTALGNRPKGVHYHPVSMTSISRGDHFSWEVRLRPSKHRGRIEGVGLWDEETGQLPPGQALAWCWPQGQWDQSLLGLLWAAFLVSTSSRFPLLSFFPPDLSKSSISTHELCLTNAPWLDEPLTWGTVWQKQFLLILYRFEKR